MIADGVEDGSFGAGTDPKMASIFILSILNAVERWYRSDGALDRAGLVDAIVTAAHGIVRGSARSVTSPAGLSDHLPQRPHSWGRKSDSAPVGRRVFHRPGALAGDEAGEVALAVLLLAASIWACI